MKMVVEVYEKKMGWVSSEECEKRVEEKEKERILKEKEEITKN
jgi:hypothetical protein